jgi:outer membrane protein assembly factor BamB
MIAGGFMTLCAPAKCRLEPGERFRVIGAAALVAAVLFVATAAPAAADWASWRGPAQNGVSEETGLVSSWSLDGKNLIWKADFIGRSTPVVIDGRVCVIGRTDGDKSRRQEVVACYDATNGALLWEHRHNVYQTTVPYNRVGWASLAADPETGMVYAHGVAGQLIAFDVEGKIVWSHFPTEEVGRYSGYGGRTQTPVVDGDLLIINFVSSGWGDQAPLRHRYFAFDKRSGEQIWVSAPSGMPKDFNTQSAPVVAEIAGRRLLIAGGADGWVYAMDVATGEKIWAFHLSKRGLNATVLVEGTRVYASHSEENVDEGTMGRLVCIDGTGEGDVTATHELWRINELAAGFPSPSLHDGRLYVLDNSANLHDIDAASGEIRWTYSLGTVGKASPVVADGKLYASEVNGRFHILQPTATEAKPLDMDELEVEDGRYAEIYGSPAVAYGRVFLATEGGLYCIGNESAHVSPGSQKRRKSAKKARGKGEPATLQVIPGEVIAGPGETLRFRVRLLDSAGFPLKDRKVEWSLDGLTGRVGDDGTFSTDADSGVQTGTVTATLGSLTGKARVRVIPDLPWVVNFDEMEPGQTPPHWINAARKFVVAELDGEKVLHKAPRARGLNRTTTYMGSSELSDYTIEAEVMGLEQGRRKPDIGLVNGGYILDLLGAHQQVQLRSWTSELRMATQSDFSWELGKWYHLKFRVELTGEKALLSGKIWPRGTAEPAEWTITAEDELPIRSGSPGLVAYSPTDVYYDNIKVTVNE